MKMLACILMIVFLAGTGRVVGQHYIGRHKSEVREMMKKYERGLHEDKSSRNSLYNMVKYIDNDGSQTLIYVFSDQDTCRYSKWMCDYSMLNKVVDGLNEAYEASVEDSWHYSHEGKDYVITLKTGDWFFTITTKQEVKQ